MAFFKKLLLPKRKSKPISRRELDSHPGAEVEQLGLFLLTNETTSPHDIDIIAVHGLGGHYQKTWTEANGEFWLRDSVPSKLQDSKLNSRVFSYGYNSSTAFSKAVTDITDEAAMLLERIRGERKSQSDRLKPIIFIAHSLGGILVKKAMIHAHQRLREYGELLDSIKGVIFFGTPHRGSDAAYWASYAARVLKTIQLGRGTNDKFVSDLRRNSKAFAEISEQWVERAAPLRIRTFYETELLYGEHVVDKDSARLGLPNEVAIGIAGSNHKSMCKFGDFNSQKYKPVSNAVEELVEHALGGLRTTITGFLNREDYTKEILLQSGVKVAKSSPPDSFDLLCDNPAAKESLEWLIKSPEYETWINDKSGASLWLYGPPGNGKTFAAAYVLKSLSKYPIYTKKRLVASIFCSPNDSDMGLVTSLALQLIAQDENRAHTAQEKMAVADFQNGMHTDEEMTRNMWKLFETLIMTGSNYETVIIIDGIDEPDIRMRTPFLENFCALQANVQGSAVIRVLITSRPYADIKKILAHYPSIDRDSERKACLDTLFFEEWNAREIRIETITEGGSWLSSNDAYKLWIMDPLHNFLWIEGKPGSGKSTLAKHIVRKIREKRASPPRSISNQAGTLQDPSENETTIISEFYYSFRGGCKETSHKLMLQSIVYQIWKQNSRLFYLIQDQYRKLAQKEVILWSYEDLKSTLNSLHSVDFDLRVVIIVDAMDESDSYNRTDVLQFLHFLSSRENHHNSRCSIKLLVASRPEIRPNPRIGKIAHIILQKENDADIRVVVNNWIETIGVGDHHVLSEIKDYIVKHSDGVFLWVTLVLRGLELYIKSGAFRLSSLRAYLGGLPKELGGRDGYYRAMIDSLIKNYDQALDKKERMEDGQRVVAWTTFSKRPLLLSELTDVLATPAQSERMDPPNKELTDYRPRDMDRGILTLCGGLVELRETHSGQIVQLIHLTAREFLLDQNPPPPAEPYNLDESQGDFEIANTCCRYLRIVFEAKTHLEVDSEFSHVEELTEHLSNHPLLNYAINHFHDHLHHSHPGDKFAQIREEFEIFIRGLGEKKSYSSLLLSRWIRSLNWPNLHLDIDETSATNCLDLVLTWAAGAGKDEPLEVLLALGADIDNQRNNAITPLINAAQSNHTSTVKLLLNKGANANVQGGYYGNALQAASEGGHEQVVRMLIEKGAEVNAQGGYYGNALQAASYAGHEFIVKLLLDHGADVDAQGGHYGNALQAASYAGHEFIVKLLLDHGAYVHAQGGHHGNALQAASYAGHEFIVKLLLDHGAYVNAQGGPYDNALQAASYAGHSSIITLLLQSGADVNAQGGFYGNALQAASYAGHDSITRLLFANGAHDVVISSQDAA